jgi:peptidoglycan/LPS O-acetylase OafA/YrhL
MRFGVGVLAVLLAAAVPAIFVAGETMLRGLGWAIVVIAAAVLLIDAADRLTEWIQRRRWGRVARHRDRYRSDDGT